MHLSNTTYMVHLSNANGKIPDRNRYRVYLWTHRTRLASMVPTTILTPMLACRVTCLVAMRTRLPTTTSAVVMTGATRVVMTGATSASAFHAQVMLIHGSRCTVAVIYGVPRFTTAATCWFATTITGERDAVL